MKVTFLGTGSSLGVPIIGCQCPTCQSLDNRDKRMRSAVLIEIDHKVLLIDAGPDFRQQMLLYNPHNRIDAILITHAHRDHIAGLDDIRPYNFMQKKNIPLYAEKATLETIKQIYSYTFEKKDKSGLPNFDLLKIDENAFYIGNTQILPVRLYHNIPLLGFRIQNFAYLTDIKAINISELPKLKNLDTMVISVLRIEEHSYHFNLAEALDFINLVKPKKTYITHLGHTIGPYEQFSLTLPQNVFMAYDGLCIEV